MTSRIISLTARLALGFVGILVLAHVGICMYLDYAFQDEFAAEDYQVLAADARYIGRILSELKGTDHISAITTRLRDIQSRHAGLLILIRDANAEVAAASDDSRWLAEVGSSSAVHGRTPAPLFLVEHDGRKWRLMRSKSKFGDAERTPVDIVVAIDITAREQFASRYRSRLVVAAIIAALVAGAIGLPLVRSALKPLRLMARRAAEISASRLDERLPETNVPRELREFSAAFNQMLERLQDSFRRLSQFSSDLAHDMRTPIGNLMGEAQVALSRPRSLEEYQNILASAVEEYERIGRMIDGMLFLARADNAGTALRCTQLDGRCELFAVAEYYEGLLAESGLTLSIDGQAMIWADSELLRRAVSNLLSNAISHTPRSGAIKITLAQHRDGSAEITVSNPGSGIAQELIPRVFDRFFRANTAREASHRGSGLGLAIVRSIVELHGGRATVHSVEGRETTFTLWFPAPRKADQAATLPEHDASFDTTLAAESSVGHGRALQ